MQVTSNGVFRGLMTGAIALGFMGTAALSTPVSAQRRCLLHEPGLALFDQDSPKDGIL